MKFMKKALYISATCSILFSSCGTVQSTRSTDFKFDQNSQGMTYFLPMKLVKLKISSEPSDIKKAKEKLKGLESKYQEFFKKSKELASKLENKQKLLLKLDQNSKPWIDTQNEIIMLNAEVGILTPKLKDALKNFGEAKVLVETHRANPNGCIYSISSSLTEALPNPSYKFNLIPKHSPLRDDKNSFSVTTSGLLTSANVEVTDRTGDVLVQVAGATSPFHGIKSGGAEIRNEGHPSKCLEYPIEVLFDPLKPTNASAQLNNLDIPIKISAVQTLNGSPISEERFPNMSKPKTGLPSNFKLNKGLFYQTPAPIIIGYEFCKTADKCYSISSTVAMLPQAGPVSFLPLESSTFVKTVDEVKFEDGTLVSWTNDRPSEILSIAGLPVAIGKAIFSIPAEIFSFKVDYSTQAQALSQLSLSKAQADAQNQAFIACLDSVGEDYTDVLTCVSQFTPTTPE